MKLRAMAWRNVLRNRNRSLLSASAMLVVSAVLVFGFSVLEGMMAELKYNVHTFTYGQLKVRNPDFEKNQALNPLHLNVKDGNAMIRWVEAREETESAAPRITFGSAIQRGDKRYQAQGWGIDLEREKVFSNLEGMVTEGRLPVPGEREAVMGIGLARNLGIKVGDKFTFMTITKNRSLNGVTLKVTGLVDIPVPALSGLVFMTSLEKAKSFLQMDDAVLEIVVKVKHGIVLGDTAAKWNGTLAPQGLKATSWEESSFVYAMIQVVSVIYRIIAFMFVLLGSAVIINTTMMVVFERRTEIGTLGALGMHGHELVILFLLESLYLAGAGAGAGVALGAVVSASAGKAGIDMSALFNGINLEFPAVLRPVLSFNSVMTGFSMTVILSGIASLLPSWMAARIKPVEALRN